MSKLQASRTIKFISKVGTFTAALRSNMGQLWQMYQATDSAITDSTVCTPDYTSMTNKPVLNFVVISSRTSSGTSLTGLPNWYFGGDLMNDASRASGLKAMYEQYFALTFPTVDTPYYGLQIKKNLPVLSNGTSVNIKAVGTISGTNYNDEVHAETTINITPTSSDKMIVNIIDMTNKNFTFTAESENITLKAELYQGTEKKTANLTYLWQKIENGNWVNIKQSGADVTTQTITINEDDVMTYCKIRCAMTYNNGPVFYGFAPLMDATDPYILIDRPHKVLANGTTTVQDDVTLENVGEKIVFEPWIVTRSNPSQQAISGEHKYHFMLMSSSGIDYAQGLPAYHGADNQGVTTAEVGYDLAEAIGDIDVIIETAEDFNDYN